MHAGDAILNDNWHTNEVFSHARNNFEGYTFAMRTLEAWGAHVPERPPRLLHGGRPRLGFTPEEADKSLSARDAKKVMLIPKPFTGAQVARALTELLGP